MKTLKLLACAVGILTFAPPADASLVNISLYAATGGDGPGELYILDAATGAVIEDIGPLNDSFGINYPITGLAFHPSTGVLYGSTANQSETTAARLVTINPLTALVTVVGEFNAGNPGLEAATMADIAFDAAGNLYGIGSVDGPHLYAINVFTAQATVIGNTGLNPTAGGGLAISGGGAFYGTPTEISYGTYDSTTGAFSNIANPNKPVGGGTYAALDFDGDGVLYGINLGSGSPAPTRLVIIDETTGAVTDIGSSVASIDAIAFTVPEPTAATLCLACGMIGLLMSFRKHD